MNRVVTDRWTDLPSCTVAIRNKKERNSSFLYQQKLVLIGRTLLTRENILSANLPYFKHIAKHIAKHTQPQIYLQQYIRVVRKKEDGVENGTTELNTEGY